MQNPEGLLLQGFVVATAAQQDIDSSQIGYVRQQYRFIIVMGLGCKTVFMALADDENNRLQRFYQPLFAQDPVVNIPNVYAEFQLPGLRLGLFHPKADHQVEFGSESSGGMSLCIEVEDLERAIAHLTAIGYPPPGPIQQASHGREIYAYDPCGNRLILYEAVSLANDVT